jgi:nucleotide-binding universal stress UspA family protein
MRHIVCMIAGDERDAGPIGVAKMLARRTDATVALLHARVPGADPPVFDEPGVSVLLDDGPAADVAARALERLSADLLVMGRSEDGTPGHGEHGRSILRAAGCPVLVIPERAPLTFASAVVGMDLSPGALEALAWAHALVSPAAAPRITCVAIVSPEGAKPEALGRSFRAAIAERGLAEPELELVPGASPADALVERSARCDLVCVGSRGLSPLASALLGSTAERVAARAACPVLVVRHRGDARGLFGALFG